MAILSGKMGSGKTVSTFCNYDIFLKLFGNAGKLRLLVERKVHGAICFVEELFKEVMGLNHALDI